MNCLKKLSILTLSSLCLWANNPSIAMDSERKDFTEKSGLQSSLYKSQLHESVILDISQLDESQLLQLSKIMSGLKSGQDLTRSVFDVKEDSFKNELSSLQNQKAKPLLWPKVDAIKTSEALANVCAVYFPIVAFYEESQDLSCFNTLGVSGEDKVSLVKLLLETKPEAVNAVSDPAHLIMFLRLLNGIDLQTCFQTCMQLTQNDWQLTHSFNQLFGTDFHHMHGMGMYGMNPVDPNNFPLLKNILTTKSGVFKVLLSELYEQFVLTIQQRHFANVGGDAQQQQGLKDQLIASVRGQINKLFNIAGTQYFDIAKDGDMIDAKLSSWMNLSHQLAQYELKKWAVQGIQLDHFIQQISWAKTKLSESQQAGKMYSGVAIAPYSVALIATGNKEKAETVEFLTETVDEHVKPYETEITAYTKIKGSLPTLQKVVDFFDSLSDSLVKAGKIS